MAAGGARAAVRPDAPHWRADGDLRSPRSRRQGRVTAFEQDFKKLGWTAGRNIRIDDRWAGDADRMRAYAEELVGMTPDVILAHSVRR